MGPVPPSGVEPYWTCPLPDLVARLDSGPGGLTSAAANVRHAETGQTSPRRSRLFQIGRLLLSQFSNPITIILIFAAILAWVLQDAADGAIILGIILAGAMLGFWQEFHAATALEALAALVQPTVTALRDGREREISPDQIVSGDIIILSAGSSVPADCRLVEARDLHINEAALTGESFPIEKQVGTSPVDCPLARRTNVLFRGSHVVSGSGRALVVFVGDQTEMGRLGRSLRLRPPENEFERGIRRLGTLLLEITLLLVLSIFVTHLGLHRPALESFLFAMALAVGLTPQLLPAVISVNLAYGARRLAAQSVIVRKLTSIENFGSMNVLCSDKTGTLTEGIVQIEKFIDCYENASVDVRRCARLNAMFESGFRNPIDEALRQLAPGSDDEALYEKRDEIPYDFVRKRLSVLVARESERTLLTKGAVANVLEACDTAASARGEVVPLAEVRHRIEELQASLGIEGRRTLAVASRHIDRDTIDRSDETGMTFLGLIVLCDPPKAQVVETIQHLKALGIALKVITGDSRAVASSVARHVGLADDRLLTGSELRSLSDEALVHRAGDVAVFAEIEPNQKERIILALKKAGNVVGYLGDGINDAAALHAADVGVSVDGAVDVAREAADIVLMKHDLDVLVEGVRQGRATFANTLKYVFLATSANFGNMFSMAGASLFLGYLPLLPRQILLTNFLTDLPEMTIAHDRVDSELMERPQRWDVPLIRRFMLAFGVLSSLFDYATFAVLLLVLRAGTDEFRTGWFVESVVSACVIVLIIRSRQPLGSNRPGTGLVVTTAAVIMTTIALPYSPLAPLFGFVRLPLAFLVGMLIIVVLYGIAAEFLKRAFFRRKPASIDHERRRG